MFYALATNEKNLKDKVNLFVALAPVCYFKNSTKGKSVSSLVRGNLFAGLEEVGIFSLFGHDQVIDNSIYGVLFSTAIGLLKDAFMPTGTPFKSEKWMKVQDAWYPARTSTKGMQHYI